MQKRGQAKQRQLLAVGRHTLTTVCGLMLLQPVGCVRCNHLDAVFLLDGVLLDAETLEAAADAAVGGCTLTDGEETVRVPALIFDGTPNGPPPDEDGRFQLEFRISPDSCRPELPEFPRPDQIEIIVAREGCEQTFLIDINEDTVVDLDFPDDVIQVKDPILVGPCTE